MTEFKNESDIGDLRRAVRFSRTAPADNPNDFWEHDAPLDKNSYGSAFIDLLKNMGVSTFEELLYKRKEQKKSTNVLDLFGSGYFLDDLSATDSITGIRRSENSSALIDEMTRQIKDGVVTQQYQITRYEHAIQRIRKMQAWPHWKVISGNLFTDESWNSLKAYQMQKTIPSFDLITSHAFGAYDEGHLFDYTDWRKTDDLLGSTYGQNFLRLLDRSYSVLSFNEGMLFSDLPVFLSGEHIENLKLFGEKVGNFKINIMQSGQRSHRKHFSLTKSPNSIPMIENGIRSFYKDLNK